MMTEDQRWSPGPIARSALLGSALLLSWVSLRAAVQANFTEGVPQLAAQMWPANGQSLAALGRLRVAAANGEIDETTRGLVANALRREPLLADPLAIAGLDAATAGDTARAERLMVAARNRDPRLPLARFWLFDHYIRKAEYGRALDEVGPAIRLQNEAVTAIMTVLAAVASDPDGRAALAAKLASQPFWRTSFFQTATKTAAPEVMLALLSAVPKSADNASALQEQRAVFLALIDAGKGAQAYEKWRELLPDSYRSRARGVYDGSFARWPGAQPFNWFLASDDIGTARMVTAGDLPQSSALQVRYFGSTAGMLAEQYVYATPGRYRLELSARRRSTGATGGRLSIEVRCLSGEIVANLPLEPLEGQLRGLSVPLQVAPGCELLRVRVMGTPGEVFSEVEAQITGLALVRGG